MKIEFERATINDIDELINVRNQSFYEDYVKYGECPGYNLTKESMTNIILSRIVYKIIYDNQMVGSISIKDNNDNTYYLGCLCVIPDYENKGIGQEALRFIERKFPNAIALTLETPADKERNHYFYKKSGYNIIKEYMNGSVKLVLFEKKFTSVSSKLNYDK
ncbi:GNAT family N-acetyltransferase [Clostridium sp.]|uniref:GNAT family N-acetyltransferase n=1 Tax=Clostridium sp. TaxID=1506 RepID=UPI002841FF7E|nr:GNAT family N-acetyltransferase [Clostridium sp.]MDR3594358.1 GNAT family N-acetyltransferase [Clostridium sp.]